MSQGQGRRRARGRGKPPSTGSVKGDRAGGQKSRNRNEPKVDPVQFWGDPELLPDPISAVRSVPDVKAVVQSLGRVPLAGQETAAEHWFSLVYERAAVLAGALAAAGELEQVTEEIDTD